MSRRRLHHLLGRGGAGAWCGCWSADLALSTPGAGWRRSASRWSTRQVGDTVLVHAKEAIAVDRRVPPVRTVRVGRPTGMESLYPFLYAGQVRRGRGAGRRSASPPWTRRRRSCELRRRRCAGETRPGSRRAPGDGPPFAAGGRLFAFGNGGSSTDAQDGGRPCSCTRAAGRGPLPALSPDHRRRRGHRARPTTSGSTWCSPARSPRFGRPGDIAVGLSTSGDSANVVRGLRGGGAAGHAHRRPRRLRRRPDGRARTDRLPVRRPLLLGRTASRRPRRPSTTCCGS